MKRQVLFVGCDAPYHGEIREYLKSHGGEASFASSPSMAISMLDKHPIATVVICLHQISDTAVLKYINENHPDTKVLVQASDEFMDIIQALTHGHFSLIAKPLKLKELEVLLA